MKKLLYTGVALTVFSLAFASCKKEDTNGNPDDITVSEDVIVGTWKLVSKTENGEAYTDSCGLAQGKYSFNADGRGKVEGANTSSLSGECVPFSYAISSWEKTADNKYTVHAGSGSLAITREWTTVFSNNNNRLEITQYEEEDDETDISIFERQ